MEATISHNPCLEWLRATYEQADGFAVLRCKVYADYRLNCGLENPLSQSTFGKLLRQVFPDVQVRRLGTKRVAYYHYVGIRRIGDTTAKWLGSARPSRPNLAMVHGRDQSASVSNTRNTKARNTHIQSDITHASATLDTHGHPHHDESPTMLPAYTRLAPQPHISRKCFHKPTLILPPFLLTNPVLAADPEARDMANRLGDLLQTLTDLILNIQMNEVLSVATLFWESLPVSAACQLCRDEFISELIGYVCKVMDMQVQWITPDSLIFGEADGTDEDHLLLPCCVSALTTLCQQTVTTLDELALHDTLLSVSFKLATAYVPEILHRFLRPLQVRIPLVLVAHSVRKVFGDSKRMAGVRRAWVDLMRKTEQEGVMRESEEAAVVQFSEMLYSQNGLGTTRKLLEIFSRSPIDSERLQAVCGMLLAVDTNGDKELEAGQLDLRSLLEFVVYSFRMVLGSQYATVAF